VRMEAGADIAEAVDLSHVKPSLSAQG
jgi:hypothetical protein